MLNTLDLSVYKFLRPQYLDYYLYYLKFLQSKLNVDLEQMKLLGPLILQNFQNLFYFLYFIIK
jgi:hypothetical protein